jgi:hypothetical protein
MNLLRYILFGDDGKTIRTSSKALPSPSSETGDARLPSYGHALRGNTGITEPDWNTDITKDGSVVWMNVTGRRPTKGAVHSLFEKWLTIRQEYGHSLPYPLYSIARFGVRNGLWRIWEYHLHPKNAWHWTLRRYRKLKLIDRRPKKGWNNTVYAVDRDGDLFLVECPKGHHTQHVFFNWNYEEKKACTNSVPPKTFECLSCGIGFRVYLEDGLRRIRDHRDGTPPLPSMVVWDDNHELHLGISKDAPWWWKRREIYRDLHDGKDAHGHKPYEIFPIQSNDMNECGNSQQAAPETEQFK